jgi:LysM repeat protein
MNKSTIQKTLLVLLMGVFLLLGWSVVEAQTANLLTNPGFEDPYLNVGGEPARQVAQGWTPWHVGRTANMPDYENTQPEYAPAAPETARIRSGGNAQLYSSFYATHDGGVFQRVTGISPGTRLRFSVYAYVWSTTFDDRDSSEDPGDVVLQVGIDPSGGTDGTSQNIVWSTAVSQYDAYREYSVMADATGMAVTVFVRSRVGFPVQYSNIYLDDAVLAPATGTSPADTDTPVPSTNTPVPPTNTPKPSNTPVPPTNTPVVVATTDDQGIVTSTPIPATEVPTLIPAATFTPVPPATFTLEPTDTPSAPTPTAEGMVPTATPLVLATATPKGTTPISDTFPNTTLHTVRSGDTVGALAIQYNSTVEAIIEANGLDTNALIYVGQGLVIPIRTTAAPTTVPGVYPTFTVAPGSSGATATTTGTGGGAVSNLYIVKRGDTLSRIAAQFTTTVAAMAQLNGIVNPDRISIGQSILVPAPAGSAGIVVPTVPPTATPVSQTTITSNPQTYMVLPGDNLFRISLRFNVSMLRLMQANSIVNPNRIFAGQTLVIPS